MWDGCEDSGRPSQIEYLLYTVVFFWHCFSSCGTRWDYADFAISEKPPHVWDKNPFLDAIGIICIHVGKPCLYAPTRQPYVLVCGCIELIVEHGSLDNTERGRQCTAALLRSLTVIKNQDKLGEYHWQFWVWAARALFGDCVWLSWRTRCGGLICLTTSPLRRGGNLVRGFCLVHT